jgi:hypothetical protein
LDCSAARPWRLCEFPIPRRNPPRSSRQRRGERDLGTLSQFTEDARHWKPHSTRSPCFVERDRIETDILAPERVLESGRQIVRCSIECHCRFMLTQAPRTSRHRSLCGIGVALNLTQGGGALRQSRVNFASRLTIRVSIWPAQALMKQGQQNDDRDRKAFASPAQSKPHALRAARARGLEKEYHGGRTLKRSRFCLSLNDLCSSVQSTRLRGASSGGEELSQIFRL